jgi:hypothetical protein
MAQAQFQIPQALVALGNGVSPAGKAIFDENVAGVEVESELIAEARLGKEVEAGFPVL